MIQKLWPHSLSSPSNQVNLFSLNVNLPQLVKDAVIVLVFLFFQYYLPLNHVARYKSLILYRYKNLSFCLVNY
jgi:hypothetical protein